MDELDGQLTWSDLDTWSGKMFQEPLVPTGEKTSKQSSRKSQGSQNQTLPMCLCLRRGSGQSLGAYTMRWEDGALLGDFTMLSTGEYPKEENVSRLSQILVDSVLPKYYLSAKACQGILNRAERRGKELPAELKEALENQCRLKETEPGNPIAEMDSGGGGDPSFTLNGVEHHGVAYSFDAVSSNSMKSDNPHSGCREVDTARTLDCFDPNPAKNQGGGGSDDCY